MKLLLLSAFFASLVFLVIDVLWLSISVKTFYRPNLSQLLLDKPIFWAAALFYIMYVIGVTVLIIQPSIEKESLFNAFYMGCILGFVAYGTYNLTNMATIKGWSPYVVIVDMFWGGFLTGLSSSLGIFIAKKIVN
tara:strand:- start:167 stop:571 length:405 start_codon:yes stop_codon:yes gene_type:complete